MCCFVDRTWPFLFRLVMPSEARIGTGAWHWVMKQFWNPSELNELNEIKFEEVAFQVALFLLVLFSEHHLSWGFFLFRVFCFMFVTIGSAVHASYVYFCGQGSISVEDGCVRVESNWLSLFPEDYFPSISWTIPCPSPKAQLFKPKQNCWSLLPTYSAPDDQW